MEILREIRASWWVGVLKTVIVGTLLMSLYNVLAFNQDSSDAINRSFSSEARVNLYTLVDTLTDADEFSSFRQSDEALHSLADFYNGLSNDSTITLISSFDQPITIANFEGGDIFDEGYGGVSGVKGPYRESPAGPALRDVKALQLSEKAFDFYGLEVVEGDEPTWSAVDYMGGTVPVLLGADYAGTYSLGDTLDAALYSKRITLRVVGFLGDREAMFYKNDINFPLSDKVILPYPASIGGYSQSDKYFAGILYFAMINGDLVADTDVPSDEVLTRIAQIANQAGFTEYSLINLPSYVTQYDLTKRSLQNNQGLVAGTLLLVTLITLAVVTYANLVTARRRGARILVFKAVGYSTATINRPIIAVVVVEGVFLLAFLYAAWLVLPNRNLTALSAATGALLALCTLDVLCQLFTTNRHARRHVAERV